VSEARLSVGFPLAAPREPPVRGVASLASPHGWFVGASLLVCLVCYGDVVFGGRTFVPIGRSVAAYEVPPFSAGYRPGVTSRAELDPGATAWQVIPWTYQEHRALRSGELPLWNRHAGFGSPLLGNGQTATFSPLHWPVVAAPDSPVAWDASFLLLRFLAALFGCYLAAALGVRKDLAMLAAPFGAVNAAFTIFVTRADLAAYATLPAVLLFVVQLRRRATLGRAIALALAMGACLSAGHPEPSFSSLFTCALAALGLCAMQGVPLRRYLAFLAGAAVLAAVLSAPFWMPFLARVHESWNVHPPGTASAMFRPGYAALQWLAPYAFAKSTHSLFDAPLENVGFLGMVMGTVALLALPAALLVRGSWRRLLWVCGPMLVALAIYRVPVAVWIVKLPLLDRMPVHIYFPFPATYLFGIAGIVALDALGETQELRRRIAACIAAGLALGAILLATRYADFLSPTWARQRIFYAILAATSGAMCWLVSRARSGSRARTVLCLLLLLAVATELRRYRLPLAPRGDFAAMPPYAWWLRDRQQRESPFRVLGLGYTMMPNLATAWGLEDVRLCDALIAPEYLQFIHRFVQKDLEWGWVLTGRPEAGFDARSPILDWINLRYFVGRDFATTLPTNVESMLLGAKHAAWGHAAYEIDDETMPLLSQHPNDEGTVVVRVPSKYPVLAFALAQDPAIWDAPGDGATYEIAIAADGAPPLTVFSREIDPKQRKADRHWIRGTVDLSRWAGRDVALTLRARSENTASDWGGWGGLHWQSLRGERQPGDEPAPVDRPAVFRGDRYATVFENPTAWPRVFAVSRPFIESGQDQVLDRIAALSRGHGGPYAVVSADDFPARDWHPTTDTVRGEIGELRYTSNRLSFEAAVDAPAILVVSDAFNSGWTARVDGLEQRIFRANYLFRGLVLGPGTHRVEFRYWPAVWTVALAVGVSGWSALALWAVLAARRRFRSRMPTAS